MADEESARQNGLNCIAFVHLALRKLYEADIPRRLRAYEMFHDDEWFDEVDDPSSALPGDVFFFMPHGGREKLSAFEPQFDETGNIVNLLAMPRVHLAIVSRVSDVGEPILMHANYRDKGVGAWAISQFQQLDRYAEIAAIKRLRDAQAPAGAITPENV